MMSKPVTAEILPTQTRALFDRAVQRSAAWLREGGVVALPTETVYGLAANATNPQAVRRLFEIKGRPQHNPIIVHVASLEMARQCVAAWPKAAHQLAAAFWPGPLTVVLPRAPIIAELVTAGGPTVGVRWPSHPLIQAVIRECGFPLAAPSANRSAELSPTTAEHVARSLGRQLRLIVDGGPSQVGIESTVIDLTVHPPAVLRPGMIHTESLEAVLGGRLTSEPGAGEAAATAPRSPGLLRRHYAPRATLTVLAWQDEAGLRGQIATLACAPSQIHIIAHTHIPLGGGFGRVSVVPHDAAAFARALYAELHRCDLEGARCIVVEAPPAGPAWEGIRDRLHRAAAGKQA